MYHLEIKAIDNFFNQQSYPMTEMIEERVDGLSGQQQMIRQPLKQFPKSHFSKQ